MSEKVMKNEKWCGVNHNDVQEAINHACEGLVRGNKSLLSEPYWGLRGGTIANVGKVVGRATPNGKRRWRLDFDPLNRVHINEEDFTFARPKKLCHRIIRCSQPMAMTYWNKWTSRYDKPSYVIEAEKDIDRIKRERPK